MKKDILKENICAIAEYLLLKDSSKDLSFVSGITGHLLFFGYSYDITGNERYLIKSAELFDSLLSHISLYSKEHTLANGVTGFLSTLLLLEKRGLIDLEFEMLKLLTNIIFKSIEKDRKEKNYDLLHGMIGKAFVLSQVEGTKKQLEQIINALLSFVKQSGKLFYWNDYYVEDETAFIDLGFAHGISSIAVFLSRNIHLAPIKITHVLKGILEVYELVKRPNPLSGFYPGSFVIGKPAVNLSRLGWCYGDLCVLLAKIEISRALCLPLLKQKVLEESIQITRRLLDDSGVITGDNPFLLDRGFCHGTVGLAIMFNRLADEFQHTLLIEARDYWLSLTLANNVQPEWWLFPRQDNITGEITWNESTDALDGITGVGLSFCNLYNSNYNWTNSLAI